MGLDSFEYVIEIKDEFVTKIPDEVAQTMRTVRDLVEWLMTEGHSGKAEQMGREQVVRIVREFAAEQMGIQIEKISEDSRFVEDLGMG